MIGKGTVHTNAKHNLRGLAAAVSATKYIPSIVTLLTVLQNMDHQHVPTLWFAAQQCIMGDSLSGSAWGQRSLSIRQVRWLGPEGL